MTSCPVFCPARGPLRLLFAHLRSFSSAAVRDGNALICRSCWRRGAGSNRRIKVLQDVLVAVQKLLLQQLRFYVVRLLSDHFATLSGARNILSYCFMASDFDFARG